MKKRYQVVLLLMVPVKSEEGRGSHLPEVHKSSPVHTMQVGWKAAGGPCGPTGAGAARAFPYQRPMAPSDGGRAERSRVGWIGREGRVSWGRGGDEG